MNELNGYVIELGVRCAIVRVVVTINGYEADSFFRVSYDFPEDVEVNEDNSFFPHHPSWKWEDIVHAPKDTVMQAIKKAIRDSLQNGIMSLYRPESLPELRKWVA